MYCIHCGVRLGESEAFCPLCGTVSGPPERQRVPLYPAERRLPRQVAPKSLPIVLTTLTLIPLLITLLVDLRLHRTVTWSGFVMGALVLTYTALILPLWFFRPNPVIFVPCAFGAAGLYLWYICAVVGGHWFGSFALPLTAVLGLVTTAVVTLLRYVRRGMLYIFGGALILLGLFMPVLELLVNVTFAKPDFAAWSIYPLTALLLLGGMLIFLAICRPARAVMERKFFL